MPCCKAALRSPVTENATLSYQTAEAMHQECCTDMHAQCALKCVRAWARGLSGLAQALSINASKQCYQAPAAILRTVGPAMDAAADPGG
jgi:hypothetical protein